MTVPITVLLVPGFQEAIADRDYATVMRNIERLGYVVRFVPMRWRYTTQRDWLRQLNEQYSLCDPATTILVGFSYGACVALMAATKRSPRELWLCSLSPLFAEFESEWDGHDWRVARKRRLELARGMSLKSLAKQITCSTTLFIGAKEMTRWPIMGRVMQTAARYIRDSRAVVVKNVGHAIDNPEYIRAIMDSRQGRAT